MNATDKLSLAFYIFNEDLKEVISTISLQTLLARVYIEAKDKSRIFVRYNNYGEYAYSQIYSNQYMDRIRFDNYDEMWDVTSNPNHFHPWQREDAISSPMIGDPENDIPVFIKLIKRNVMRDPNFTGFP